MSLFQPNPDTDWPAVRAEWERGVGSTTLAKTHGCHRSTVQRRARREGWTRPNGSAAAATPKHVEEPVPEGGAGTVAGFVGLTLQQVAKLARDGILPGGPRGDWPVRENVLAYVKYLRNRGRGADTPQGRLNEVRRKRELVKLEREKTRNAVDAGELVPAKDFAELVDMVLRAVREVFDQMPARLAGELATMDDAAAILALLEADAAEQLRRLSEVARSHSTEEAA